MVLGAHIKPTEKKAGWDCPSENKSQSINFIGKKTYASRSIQDNKSVNRYAYKRPTIDKVLSDKDSQAVQRTLITKKLPSTSQRPRMASAEWFF